MRILCPHCFGGVARFAVAAAATSLLVLLNRFISRPPRRAAGRRAEPAACTTFVAAFQSSEPRRAPIIGASAPSSPAAPVRVDHSATGWSAGASSLALPLTAVVPSKLSSQRS